MKPIIGLVGNLLMSPEQGIFASDLYSYVNNDYIEAVIKCGGIPLVLPVQSDEEDIIELLKRVDKIILTGGYDIDPLLYHEFPISELGLTMREVDEFYLKVIKYADKYNKPVLGICKGVQALNVAFGGTLYQDLKAQKESVMKHVQSTFKYHPSHYVYVNEDSMLYDCFGEKVLVNSFHHQAVKDVAQGFKVVAKADDGVIEAIEKVEGTYMLGLQWHPEMMITADNENMINLMKEFLKRV